MHKQRLFLGECRNKKSKMNTKKPMKTKTKAKKVPKTIGWELNNP